MTIDKSMETVSAKNDIEIPCSEAVLGEMHSLIWIDPRVRGKIQEMYGFSIIPNNFYSNIPSVKEVEESFEYQNDGKCYNIDGLFDNKSMLSVLRVLDNYSEEFDPPAEGGESECHEFFWSNSQFSFSDAMAYYTFIRAYKPQKVLEIGSGFSTLIAVNAISQNRAGSITCIEPYPRNFLDSAGVELVRKKIQDIPSCEISGFLDNGDFLFIDSTHTVKAGSDCLKIYLDLIPSIKKDIYIHVHDVFLPFAPPKNWATDLHIYWTEQYLLLAFLIDNPKIEILFGSKYHMEKNPEVLHDFMKGRAPSGGGSFWFKYNGRSCT
jgi:hypothetical protein